MNLFSRYLFTHPLFTFAIPRSHWLSKTMKRIDVIYVSICVAAPSNSPTPESSAAPRHGSSRRQGAEGRCACTGAMTRLGATTRQQIVCPSPRLCVARELRQDRCGESVHYEIAHRAFRDLSSRCTRSNNIARLSRECGITRGGSRISRKLAMRRRWIGSRGTSDGKIGTAILNDLYMVWMEDSSSRQEFTKVGH